MKKIISIYILFVFILQLAIPVVQARTVGNAYNPVLLENTEGCEGLFGDKNDDKSFAAFLQEIFDFMKFLAPALVVVFTIIEFAKAAAANDKDALMKAGKKTGIRIALALLLFFLPIIINFVFDDILHWYGTCGIE